NLLRCAQGHPLIEYESRKCAHGRIWREKKTHIPGRFTFCRSPLPRARSAQCVRRDANGKLSNLSRKVQQQRSETGLFKMPVGGQCIGISHQMHKREGDEMGQPPVFVPPLAE